MTEETRIVNVELPATLLVGGPGGTEKEFPTTEWAAEWILENALHGLKQRRSDKLSVTKDKAKLAELDAKIEKGEPLAGGGGGGGPKQGATTKGWIAFFALIDHKEAKKAVNGSTLKRAQRTLCRQDLLASDPELAQLTGAEIEAAVTENLPDWIEYMEENDEDLVEAIEHAKKASTKKKFKAGGFKAAK